MFLYPNPTNNELNMNFDLTKNYGIGTVKIIDNMGRIVFEQQVQLFEGTNTNKLNLNLSAGLYNVMIYSEQLSLPVQELIVK
jgi:hypothetical protein